MKKRISTCIIAIIFILLVILASLSYFIIQENNKQNTQIWRKGTEDLGEAKSLPSDMFSYYVLFEGNGGTGTMQKQTMYNYGQFTLSMNKFERTGYKFVCWNTQPDGSGQRYENGQVITGPLTLTEGETITLYAQWEAVSVTGISLSETKVEIQVGSSRSLVATVNPENAKDKSVIWTSSNNSVATVENGVIRGIRSGQATITATTVDGGKTATCQIIVYPIAHYYIEFNSNGGEGEMEQQFIEYITSGTDMYNLSKNQFTRTGYHFSHWNTQQDGSRNFL